MASNIGADFVSNPGSWSDFLQRTGMEAGQEARELFDEELSDFQRDLASARGLTAEELHTMPLTYVNAEKVRPVARIAIAEQIG